MKSLRYLLSASLMILGLALPAQANHHFMQISEVFLGTAGGSNEDAQFIELRTLSANQHEVNGQQVKLYNAAGTLVETATFTSNADAATASGSAILAATTEAESMFGVTADVEFDAQNIHGGGKACFESSTFGVIDCVAWGSYSGPPAGVGTPFSPGEGIPLGAAIRRSGDTNDSRDDFSFVAAEPNGGVSAPNQLQVIQFGANTYSVSEGDTNNSIDIDRAGTTGTQVVDFITLNGTAESSDYNDEDPDPKVQFSGGDSTKNVSVETVEGTTFEGDETVLLRVRMPTAQAILGPRLNATLTIIDDDEDSSPPKSRITRPKHNNKYKAGRIMKLRGTANDGVGDVVEVRVGLRRTLKNGNCQWLSVGWKTGPCGKKVLKKANGGEEWAFPLGGKLKKSVGTNVKFYTVYSSAEDADGNKETNFTKGRNANRFEVT